MRLPEVDRPASAVCQNDTLDELFGGMIMARKLFGKSNRDNRKCPSCKGPLNPGYNWEVCEVCKTKACAVCGKISVLQVRRNDEGYSLCPRHWAAHFRLRNNQVNLKFQSDSEYQQWLASRVESKGFNLPEYESVNPHDTVDDIEAKLELMTDSAISGIDIEELIRKKGIQNN
jgi:hypothetical protein